MGANRLTDQRSPYLLHNAHSPVHWYPWGQEAIDEARKKDKPIFLSIGYGASHRCHVVDVEYFKDVISYLNEKFVCIKVDREERPDVAKVYESYMQHTLLVECPVGFCLIPDLTPFLFILFSEVLQFNLRLSYVVFRLNRFKGTNLMEFLKTYYINLPKAVMLSTTSRKLQYGLPKNALYLCASQVASSYNERYGGLGTCSRFCRPVEIQVMLYLSKELRDAGKSHEANKVLELVYFTLQCMARWGIHDHIGGGFHRIGSRHRIFRDKVRCRLDWPVPHFEKVLYDQGQLASVYLDAFSLSRDPLYSRVSRGILDFLRRDMKGVGGGFFSAMGADSAEFKGATTNKEGAFYVWTSTEVDDKLEGKAALFKDHYNIQPLGNCFLHKRVDGKELMGKNVLVETTSGMVQSKLGRQYCRTMEECREKLFNERSLRPSPDLDEMVIASWNGLAISSLARASKILKGEPKGTSGCDPREYIKVAEEAASFIQKNLYMEERLHHSCFKNVPSEVLGFLDDYAFLISGLLDLYEFGGEIKWLVWATELQEVQDKMFLDRGGGGYYYTADKEGPAIFRVKEYWDGSVPSGNSVTVINLQRLASMVAGLKSNRYRRNAEHLLTTFENVLKEEPKEVPLMCCAADMLFVPCRELVVLVRHNSSVEYDNMLAAAHASYNPHRTVIHIDTSDIEDMKFWEANNCSLAALAKDAKRKLSADEPIVVALIQQGITWSPPITDPMELKALLCGREKAGTVQKKRKVEAGPELTLPYGVFYVDSEIAKEIQNNHLEQIYRTTSAKVRIINDVKETGNPYQRKIEIKGTFDQIQLARAHVFKVIEESELCKDTDEFEED